VLFLEGLGMGLVTWLKRSDLRVFLVLIWLAPSVENLVWLSPIQDPDLCPSRIPDVGSNNSNKRGGRKKLVVLTFLWPQISQNWKHCFFFEGVQKKIWANWQKIIVLFTQKNVSKLSKIRVVDPSFGIRDSGSGIGDLEKNLFRIQGSKRPRISYPVSATLLATVYQ
jgi:hypothetical protein